MMILPERNPEEHDGQRGYPLCPGKAAGGESGGFHLGLADKGRGGGNPDGARGEIRTPDLLVRSQTLYPTELRAHAYQHRLPNGLKNAKFRRPRRPRSASKLSDGTPLLDWTNISFPGQFRS